MSLAATIPFYYWSVILTNTVKKKAKTIEHSVLMHAWNHLWQCLSSIYVTKKDNLNCKESNFMQAEAPWNADTVTLKIIKWCKFSETTELQEKGHANYEHFC